MVYTPRVLLTALIVVPPTVTITPASGSLLPVWVTVPRTVPVPCWAGRDTEPASSPNRKVNPARVQVSSEVGRRIGLALAWVTEVWLQTKTDGRDIGRIKCILRGQSGRARPYVPGGVSRSIRTPPFGPGAVHATKSVPSDNAVRAKPAWRVRGAAPTVHRPRTRPSAPKRFTRHSA